MGLLAVAAGVVLAVTPGGRTPGSEGGWAAADAGHPHEPPDHVPIAEHAFDTLPPAPPPGACAGPGIEAGCWFTHDPGGNLSAVSEPGAPKSPPGVLEVRYRAGVEAGAGVGLFQGWEDRGQHANTEYRALYESGWVRVPGPDFEMNAAGVKFLGYVGVGRSGGEALPTQVYFFSDNLPHTGEAEVRQATNLAVVQQGHQDRRLDQNVVSEPLFTFGAWHHYEILMTLNDPGRANGTVRLWLDGRLILDHADVRWRDAANPSGFWGRRWDPIWGGAGGGPKTRADHLQIDHVYMSGRPLD